jgi:hypothetical protein
MSKKRAPNLTKQLLTVSLVFLSGGLWSQSAPTASQRRLLDDALFLSPEYTAAVVDDTGSAVALFEDFNRDGRTDVALLTIAFDPRVPASVAELGSRDRLYDSGTIRALFLVEALFSGSDQIVTVELGRQVMYAGMESLPVSRSAPPAVQVSFRSQQGTTQQLVFFGPDGRTSRFKLAQSASEQSSLIDVDGDGDLEAVVARRIPEAGRGYETFLDLFELRDGSMVREDGISLVRALSRFMENVAAEVGASEWERVSERVRLGPEAGSDGHTPEEILDATFVLVEETDTRPDASETSASTPGLPTEITEVVFPSFNDNPFPEPYVGQAVRISFRVACCGDLLRIYESVVAVAPNPFEGDAFHFLTDTESRQ